MIATVLATIVVFTALIGMMAIGVILRGKSLSGSCGGVPGSACKCSNTDREACETRAAPERDEGPLKQYPG